MVTHASTISADASIVIAEAFLIFFEVSLVIDLQMRLLKWSQVWTGVALAESP